MSIASLAIGETAIAAQASTQKAPSKPPKHRLVTARSDQIQLPEPR